MPLFSVWTDIVFLQFEAQRRSVFLTGLALCAFAAILAPLAGQSSIAFSADEKVLRRRVPLPVPGKIVDASRLLTVRDPFAADDAPLPASQHAHDGGPVILRAVISGQSPRALLEEGGRMRIVEIGDRIGETTVKAIGSDRVLLSDGHVLSPAQTPS